MFRYFYIPEFVMILEPSLKTMRRAAMLQGRFRLAEERDVVMTSLHHDDGIEILATSTTMTSEVCATSHMIDIGLTLVSATTTTNFSDLE